MYAKKSVVNVVFYFYFILPLPVRVHLYLQQVKLVRPIYSGVILTGEFSQQTEACKIVHFWLNQKKIKKMLTIQKKRSNFTPT